MGARRATWRRAREQTSMGWDSARRSPLRSSEWGSREKGGGQGLSDVPATDLRQLYLLPCLSGSFNKVSGKTTELALRGTGPRGCSR